MRRVLLVLLAIMAAVAVVSCGGPLASHPPAPPPIIVPPPPQPTPAPTPPPPFVYDHHVQTMVFWKDTSAVTQPFTTAAMIDLGADDLDVAFVNATRVLQQDNRNAVYIYPLVTWGNEGYVIRPDADTRMQRIATFVQNSRRSSPILFHLEDEPPDVAWSYWKTRPDGTTYYDPNRYNADLAMQAAVIHKYLPNAQVGYNFGSLRDDFRVADGMNYIGQEAYGADWLEKITLLETLTPLPITLIPPASVTGDPMVLDAPTAQRVRDEWDRSQHDPRIVSWMPFMYCIAASPTCDDTFTGTKDFYTLGGGRLPLLLQALKDIGAQILRDAR